MILLLTYLHITRLDRLSHTKELNLIHEKAPYKTRLGREIESHGHRKNDIRALLTSALAMDILPSGL
jgi:hypothetical protein